MMNDFALLNLTIEVDGLAREVRLFRFGWNETSKGKFLFDTDAAASVMQAYMRQGTDIHWDLEHRSYESTDANATDAMAWSKLALKSDGLYATDIRWTPEGARRLRSRSQRYISPAFRIDPKSRRILELHNIALVAQPATFETPALIAASKGSGAAPAPYTGSRTTGITITPALLHVSRLLYGEDQAYAKAAEAVELENRRLSGRLCAEMIENDDGGYYPGVQMYEVF